MKIKKKDKVIVTAGKDKGKTAVVDKIFPRKGVVLLAGTNLYKKHLKPRGEGKPGGIVEIPRPLPIANIALICPKCGQPTRIGYQFSGKQKKEKLRICRKCHNLI